MNQKRNSMLYCEIGRHVRELGIHSSMTGYLYLCDCCLLIRENMNLLYQIQKGLYVMVGEINNISPCNVEKCVRKAIAAAWQKDPDRMKDRLRAYFPEEITRRPTATEVLSYIIWRINVENPEAI